ncbi:MAG: hypothetical protein AAGA54_22950 [Myxococcota bacterium]
MAFRGAFAVLCILCGACFTDPPPAASSEDDDGGESTAAPTTTTTTSGTADGGSSESGADSTGSTGSSTGLIGTSGTTGDPLEGCDWTPAQAPTVGAEFVIVVDPGTPVDWDDFSGMVSDLEGLGSPVAVLLPSSVNVTLEVGCDDGCFGIDCDEESITLVHRYDGGSGLGALDSDFDEIECVLDDGPLLPRKRHLWLLTVAPEQMVPPSLAAQLGAETSVHVSCEDCADGGEIVGPLGTIVRRTFGAVTSLEDFASLGGFLGQPRYACAWPTGSIEGDEYFTAIGNEDLWSGDVPAFATEVVGDAACGLIPMGRWDTADVPIEFFRVSPAGRTEVTQLCGPACSLAQSFPAIDTGLFDVNCEL